MSPVKKIYFFLFSIPNSPPRSLIFTQVYIYYTLSMSNSQHLAIPIVPNSPSYQITTIDLTLGGRFGEKKIVKQSFQGFFIFCLDREEKTKDRFGNEDAPLCGQVMRIACIYNGSQELSIYIQVRGHSQCDVQAQGQGQVTPIPTKTCPLPSRNKAAGRSVSWRAVRRAYTYLRAIRRQRSIYYLSILFTPRSCPKIFCWSSSMSS